MYFNMSSLETNCHDDSGMDNVPSKGNDGGSDTHPKHRAWISCSLHNLL